MTGVQTCALPIYRTIMEAWWKTCHVDGLRAEGSATTVYEYVWACNICLDLGTSPYIFFCKSRGQMEFIWTYHVDFLNSSHDLFGNSHRSLSFTSFFFSHGNSHHTSFFFSHGWKFSNHTITMSLFQKVSIAELCINRRILKKSDEDIFECVLSEHCTAG